MIGILTEADDNGVFEWKPKQIKIRIMPGDSLDVEPLLAELASADIIKRFSLNGKEYGAVRNFCRFQRPRKPKSWHPIPDEYRTYVGLTDDGSEPFDPETGEVPQKSALARLQLRTVP